ncbi:hypothetical protein D3C75_601430 [compost metagenome]
MVNSVPCTVICTLVAVKLLPVAFGEKRQVLRSPITSCQFSQSLLSALRIAIPLSGSPAKISPFAFATPASEPNPSRCAAARLLTKAASGRVRFTVQAISPWWLAPSSITANSYSGVRRNSVIGTPISLLRLPAVYSVLPHWRKIAAVISLTEVLPEEPVSATIRVGTCWRTHAANSPNAWCVSATTSCGTFTSSLRLTNNAPAPPFTASCAKS